MPPASASSGISITGTDAAIPCGCGASVVYGSCFCLTWRLGHYTSLKFDRATGKFDMTDTRKYNSGFMGLAEAFVASTNVAGEFDALWRDAATPDETFILSVLNGAEVVYVPARGDRAPTAV